MPLVDSLLTAIVRSDGDALVLHVGEKPYVVAATGSVELSRQSLGLGAMEGLLAQVLSADALRSLREMGAVEHELVGSPAAGADRFTVVAARGGDDIWIEVRRHRRLRAPATIAAPAPAQGAPAPGATVDDAASEDVLVAVTRIDIEAAERALAFESASAAIPAAAESVPAPAADAAHALASSEPVSRTSPEPAASFADAHAVAVAVAPPATETPGRVYTAPPPIQAVTTDDVAQSWAIEPTVPPIDFEVVAESDDVAPPAAPPSTVAAADPVAIEPQLPPPAAPAVAPVAVLPQYDTPATAPSSPAPMPAIEPAVLEPPAYPPIEPQPTLPGLPVSAYDAEAPTGPDAVADPPPGVVLSLTRDSARGGGPTSRIHGRAGGIERLLRLAAARGASALYLTTQARPAVRVDGDIRLLEGEATLSSGDVEAAVLELAPEGARDKESAEWIRDLQDVGRVRITTFRDYRGPGALLRMISARATSAEQLGLVREIQALAMEPEGLVIVTGPRASGKSTLVSAFVDLINRQRNDYVITLEGQIRLVHESRGSLISQRELRGSAGEIVSAARAALRENPDVLIIEDLRSPDVLQVALDAAGSGLLVFASVTAASATAALERLVDLCPSEQRRTVRAALAEHLRGVVAQVLLRKAGGGRLAARELVLNTNAGRGAGQRRPDRPAAAGHRQRPQARHGAAQRRAGGVRAERRGGRARGLSQGRRQGRPARPAAPRGHRHVVRRAARVGMRSTRQRLAD